MKRALVVEDSPAQAERLRLDLERDGFEVTLAESGEQALERLGSHAFDVVLSDVVMPGIDGYELCRQVKQRDPHLPVVLLTSLDDPIEIVHGLEAGADNFLRKPYDPEQLVSRLSTMLYHREIRGGGRAAMGLEVMLRDRRFLITAERQQILDLLISSFEDLVRGNHELQERETALRAAQSDLRSQLAATEREHRRLQAVLGASPSAIVIVEPGGTITDASTSMCRLLGRERTDVVGGNAGEVFRLTDAVGQPLWPSRETLAEIFATAKTVEHGRDFDLFLRCDDRLIPVISQAAAVRDEEGSIIAFVATFHEIGTLSAHNTLTKLPNQALFADRVARTIAQTRDGRWMAVMAIVVDRFPRLAERLTISETDTLLATMAKRLRATLVGPELGHGSGSAAYFGHDTFAAVLPHLDDDLDGVQNAQQLAQLLTAEPFLVGDHALRASVTVGVALDDGSEGDPIDLVGAAIRAARRASANGGGTIEVADPAIDARANDWLRRQAELQAAIDDEQLLVMYQPELDLRTQELWGVEALVRWSHPKRGLLAPSEFLPLAEETGLVVPLSWWVLREACRQVATWRRSPLPGAAHLNLSVNIDARQLADPDVAAHVHKILDQTGLDPTALVLEVTETGVMQNAEQAAERLREIKALGVRTAIDDFGTGYSSLVQLRRLPVDFLKIDRTFVDGMVANQDDATIVAATVRLARALGLDSLAEGVENEDQLVQLRMLGCDYAQGFHWARPMEPPALEVWWSDHEIVGTELGIHRSAAEDDSATASLDDVLAYLVHELRSPLTVIGGFAELALKPDAEEPSRYIEPILRSTHELDRRLSSLADARDAGQGAMRLQLEEVDVAALVRTLVADLVPQLGPHPVTTRVEGDPVVRADSSRLVQAVTNLVVNAAKFSPAETSIDVGVSSTGSRVVITVRDHGPGVPEERVPEMFRRFSRLGARGSGMGVGLHLVRAIARAHGGDATYQPAEDGGSCFGIWLPSTDLI